MRTREPIDYRRRPDASKLIDLNEFKTGPVILGQWEIDAAFKNARDKLDSVIKKGLPDTHGGKRSIEQHRFGSCSELAFAKIQEAIWPDDIDTFKREPDVGGMEVRSATRTDKQLLARKNDKDRAFALVVPIIPHAEWWCVGWLHRRTFDEHPEWWGDPNAIGEPCWLAPQRALVRSHIPNADEMEAFRKEQAAWAAV